MTATGACAAWAASGCRGWRAPRDGAGGERRAIFRDDADRQNFLRRLEAAAEEEDMVVFAYVLMDNHLHMVARRGG
jgi:hypothetical protein